MNFAWVLQRVLLVASLRQIICHTSLHLSTPEEQEEGIAIGTLSDTYPPPYQLLVGAFLRVDEKTGNLYTTAQKIDRESLCPSQEGSNCILTDNALVGPNLEVVKITVTVQDVNDNAPYFGTNETRLSISEDVAIGTTFQLDDEAWDEDTGSNGELSYYLVGARGFFSVAHDGSALRLTVEKELDREVQDEHCMVLVAIDGGFPHQSASISLIVTVLDADDHCPQFNPDNPHTVTLPEGAVKGSTVTQVQAADPDLDQNAQIIYSFSPQISEEARTLFKIDRATGSISLVKDVRLDSPAEHMLKVIANSPPCPTVQTQVTIYMQPVASLEPSIEIKFMTEFKNQTIVLRENEPPSVLALLELKDTQSVKGVLSLEADGMPFSLKPQAGNYLLSTSKPLDFELCSDYRIAVVIRGAQGKRVSGRKVIKVAVEDVNDNAPRFEQNHYQVELEENNKPGINLTQVRATDADSQLYGKVSYQLNYNSHAFFSIDEVTGVISVSEVLDREQQGSYILKVLARDQGSPPLEASVSVSITVLDQNDSQPSFITPHFIFFISESITHLAQVGTVKVTDIDKGENGTVVSVQVLDKNAPFAVDMSQLMLRCTGEVDREKQDHYEFLLLAVDGGHPQRSSTASVTIYVEDVNDNWPQVILPSSNLSCLTISPSTRPGSVVTKIYAVDHDSGINSDITYHILAEEPAQTNLFQIDQRSGNITLMQGLAISDKGMHHLFIVVSDGGKPTPLRTSVWVNLLINETLEPCQLNSIPSYSPRPTPGGPAKQLVEPHCATQPWLILLCGLGAMVFSACMLLIATLVFVKQRNLVRKRLSKREYELKPLN